MAENISNVEQIENDLKRLLRVGQSTEAVNTVEENSKTLEKCAKETNETIQMEKFNFSPPKSNLNKKFHDLNTKLRDGKYKEKKITGEDVANEEKGEKNLKKKRRNKKESNSLVEKETVKITQENKKSKRKTRWEILDLKQQQQPFDSSSSSSSQKILLHHNAPVKFPGTSNEVRYHNSKPISSSEQQIQQQHQRPSTSFQQMKPPPEVCEFLAKNFIYPLKKRFTKFPKAQFFCRLCDYHCDTVTVCERHIKDTRHQKNRENREMEITLHSLPKPLEAHSEVVSELISNIAQEFGLTDDDIKTREEIVNQLKEYALNDINDCSLRLYGSSLSKLGLKNSEVDIDLVVESNVKAADVLMKVYQKLRDWPQAEDVSSDFTAKIPSILFREKETRLKCIINLNNFASGNTARLLADYVSIDPRVRVLGAAFRHWAQICMIDEPSKGTLPPHSFPLMLVYYLQQCQPPILPVLHELARNENETYLPAPELNWTIKNKQNIGEIWIGLFKFYAITFKTNDDVVCIQRSKIMKRSERGWSSKRLAIEDPFISKRNLARTISNHVVAEYIFDRFKITYKYFGIPQTLTGPLFNKLLLINLEEQLDKKAKSSRLFLDVLENIAKKSEGDATAKGSAACKNDANFVVDPRMVVTIPTNNGKSKESKNGKNLAVKELRSTDDKTTQNDDKTPHSDEVESDQSASSPPDGSEHEGCIMNSLMEALDDEFETKEESKINSEDVRHRNISEVSENVDSLDSDDDEENGGEKLIEKENDNLSVTQDCRSTTLSEDIAKKKLPVELEEKLQSLTKGELLFKFDKLIFTCGKEPSVFCGLCQREGHLKQDCPDEKLPALVVLPPMDKEYMDVIDAICHRIYNERKPAKSEVRERKAILSDLQDFIRKIYPDAKLELFGSSCNGFVFASSDLDICLTFENKTSEEVKFIPIIENLAEKLKRHKHLYNVIAITTAKVPIVKFTHRPSNFEGDISLYNTLAQHNTRMLYMYSKIDERVKLLGYVMKEFAKKCSIGDASKGSLSSYAYILMVIYFLQQRDPPVIPVLQELYDKEEKQPERIVDGWNAWFYDDLQSLAEKWPHIDENKETVGELWLGLLRFYTEVFPFNEYVISIRQKHGLTRFEKLWNSKCIAIEDPFDLQHNLGAGVSRKMNHYIMKAFIKGRQIFGYPIHRDNYGNDIAILQQDILFNSSRLTGGTAPPNDRGCRLCGKIGHVIKQCPKRRQSRNREKAGREPDQRDQRDQRDRRDHHDQRMNKDAFNRNRQQIGPVGQQRPDKVMQTMHMIRLQMMPKNIQGSMLTPMHGQVHPQNLRPVGPMMPIPQMVPNIRQPHPQTSTHDGYNQYYDNRHALHHLDSFNMNLNELSPGGVRKAPITHTVSALSSNQPIVHAGVTSQLSPKGKNVSKNQHENEPTHCQRSKSLVGQPQMPSFDLPLANKCRSSESATVLSCAVKGTGGENLEKVALSRCPSLTPQSGRGLVGHPLHHVMMRPGAPPGFQNLNMNFRMPHEGQMVRTPGHQEMTKHNNLHAVMQPIQPAFAQQHHNTFMLASSQQAVPAPTHSGSYYPNENVKSHQNSSQTAPFCQYSPLPLNYQMPMGAPPPTANSGVKIQNQSNNKSSTAPHISSPIRQFANSVTLNNCQDDIKDQICFLGDALPSSRVQKETVDFGVEMKPSLSFISKNDFKTD